MAVVGSEPAARLLVLYNGEVGQQAANNPHASVPTDSALNPTLSFPLPKFIRIHRQTVIKSHISFPNDSAQIVFPTFLLLKCIRNHRQIIINSHESFPTDFTQTILLNLSSSSSLYTFIDILSSHTSVPIDCKQTDLANPSPLHLYTQSLINCN